MYSSNPSWPTLRRSSTFLLFILVIFVISTYSVPTPRPTYIKYTGELTNPSTGQKVALVEGFEVKVPVDLSSESWFSLPPLPPNTISNDNKRKCSPPELLQITKTPHPSGPHKIRSFYSKKTFNYLPLLDASNETSRLLQYYKPHVTSKPRFLKKREQSQTFSSVTSFILPLPISKSKLSSKLSSRNKFKVITELDCGSVILGDGDMVDSTDRLKGRVCYTVFSRLQPVLKSSMDASADEDEKTALMNRYGFNSRMLELDGDENVKKRSRIYSPPSVSIDDRDKETERINDGNRFILWGISTPPSSSLPSNRTTTSIIERTIAYMNSPQRKSLIQFGKQTQYDSIGCLETYTHSSSVGGTFLGFLRGKGGEKKTVKYERYGECPSWCNLNGKCKMVLYGVECNGDDNNNGVGSEFRSLKQDVPDGVVAFRKIGKESNSRDAEWKGGEWEEGVEWVRSVGRMFF